MEQPRNHLQSHSQWYVIDISCPISLSRFCGGAVTVVVVNLFWSLCLVYLSCFLLCFVFNRSVQLNMGLVPIALKFFEYNSLVFLCLSVPSEKRGFKPQSHRKEFISGFVI